MKLVLAGPASNEQVHHGDAKMTAEVMQHRSITAPLQSCFSFLKEATAEEAPDAAETDRTKEHVPAPASSAGVSSVLAQQAPPPSSLPRGQGRGKKVSALM